MATHKQLHLFEAKSADTRISRDEPRVARMEFSLANGELLVVEIPRYVLERLLVRAKRAIEAAPSSSAGVQLAIRPIPGTNNRWLSSSWPASSYATGTLAFCARCFSMSYDRAIVDAIKVGQNLL